MSATIPKGNVLVVGNSGVGKSTLINSVLGEDRAETSYGDKGTTSEVTVYEKDDCPFNLVDTAGFEPNIIKELTIIKGIRKWSEKNAKDGNDENDINVIWFCVDGMASKLFKGTLKNLVKATSVWESAPIIVVITKSFSDPDIQKNIDMIKAAAEKEKHLKKNLHAIVPVVALEVKSSTAVAIPPFGIGELIEATESAMPKGRQAAEADVRNFVLRRKRALSRGIVAGAATSAAIVGAAPIPMADAVILAPIEGVLVKALATVYGIKDDEDSQNVIASIIGAGTVGVAAKAAISAVKAIPGLNIAAAPLNAAVAASIVVGIGEVSTRVFERIYMRDEDWIDDPNWVDKVIDEVFSGSFVEKLGKLVEKLADNPNFSDAPKAIADFAISMLTNVGAGDSNEKALKPAKA